MFTADRASSDLTFGDRLSAAGMSWRQEINQLFSVLCYGG
jgi:hypothetical protein